MDHGWKEERDERRRDGRIDWRLGKDGWMDVEREIKRENAADC